MLDAVDAAPQPANYFRNTRPEIVPFVPAQRRRVLEVGCGEGAFAGSLEGVEERWGIEPNGPSAAIAAERLDRVFASGVEEAVESLPDGYFDVVVVNDVIEHLPDHDWFLDRVKRHIAPGGVLVGSLPNVRYYHTLCELILERDWCYRDCGILDRTHVHFFTEKSIRRLFAAHGYAVARLDPINRFADTHPNNRTWLYRLLAHAAIVGSAGYFRDIAFLQFAFQARPLA